MNNKDIIDNYVQIRANWTEDWLINFSKEIQQRERLQCINICKSVHDNGQNAEYAANLIRAMD